MDWSTDIAEVGVNADHCIRVSMIAGGHRPTFCIREYRQRTPGQWHPQKQGVYVAAKFLPDLIRALLKAHEAGQAYTNAPDARRHD